MFNPNQPNHPSPGTATFAVRKGEDPSEEMMGFLRLTQLSGESLGSLRFINCRWVTLLYALLDAGTLAPTHITHHPLPGGDCFLLEPIFEAEVWPFMCAPVSKENEAAVISSVSAGLRAALSGYATSIEEDLALLRSGKLAPGSREEVAVQVRGHVFVCRGEGLYATCSAPHTHTCTNNHATPQVRLGEKEALDGLLGWLEARTTELPRLEYYQERRLKRLGLMDDIGNTTYDSFFKVCGTCFGGVQLVLFEKRGGGDRAAGAEGQHRQHHLRLVLQSV